MAPAPQTAPVTVRLQRTFQAPREKVFQAWTRPEELKRWSAPGDLTTPVAEVDLRVGGRYRIDMRAPDGTLHRVTGTYREVESPKPPGLYLAVGDDARGDRDARDRRVPRPGGAHGGRAHARAASRRRGAGAARARLERLLRETGHPVRGEDVTARTQQVCSHAGRPGHPP